MSESSRHKLYYIRHGETEWNASGRVQGSRDIPLNEKGRAQASHAGGILLDLLARDGHVPADMDYVSSPLGRARVTMDLVRIVLGLPEQGYRTDDRLREVSYGDWEGLTYPEMKLRDPDIFATRAADKWGVAPPAGETYADVTQRLLEWHRGLRTDTVTVAHGGVMRALMVALGVVSAQDATDFAVGQGVVYAFVDGTVTKYA